MGTGRPGAHHGFWQGRPLGTLSWSRCDRHYRGSDLCTLVAPRCIQRAGHPFSLGLVAYALIHGVAGSLDVPPIPALFGIGESLRLGLPISSFALFPFLALLVGSRFLASRARSLLPFATATILSYALIVGVIAALGSTSVEGGEGTTVSLSAAPLSVALWSLLWALLGTTLGVAASRGPLLPA